MSKSVTIPSFNNPFVVEVNNVKYSYPAGSTQTVPDEVACVIDNINANMPKEAPEDGKQGQVWTKQEHSAAWANSPNELPATGTAGQFLKKTNSGCEWANAPTELPTYPEDPGTYTLKYDTTGSTPQLSWVADSE